MRSLRDDPVSGYGLEPLREQGVRANDHLGRRRPRHRWQLHGERRPGRCWQPSEVLGDESSGRRQRNGLAQPGKGIGETVTVVFKEPCPPSSVDVLNGYQSASRLHAVRPRIQYAAIPRSLT